MPMKIDRYYPLEVRIVEPGSDLEIRYCAEVTTKRIDEYVAMELRDKVGGVMSNVNAAYVIQVRPNHQYRYR